MAHGPLDPKTCGDVPNVGRIAILTEPGGAGIGWITPAQM